MVATDALPLFPRESRKVALAIGASLLLHALLLAWLPPLVRDAGGQLPSLLEVRLVAPAPMEAPQAEPVPKRQAVTSAAVAPVSNDAPEMLTAPAAPAVAQAVEAAPPRPPVPEQAPSPVPVTPPDLRAAYLSNPRPPYPLVARRLGLEGRVVLRAEILETGACNQILVSQSSGHEVLDQAALQAVKQWRFVPARRGGERVTAWVEVPIVFRLDGRDG